MRAVTAVAVGGSPLPGMLTSATGLPWPAAVMLSVLGLAAATALAWQMEMNRQERVRLWFALAEKKTGRGQGLDLNEALEDVTVRPRPGALGQRRRRR